MLVPNPEKAMGGGGGKKVDDREKKMLEREYLKG